MTEVSHGAQTTLTRVDRGGSTPRRERYYARRSGSKSGRSRYYVLLWKKKYGQMGTVEIREMNELRDENTRLKRLVANLSLDKVMLQDVLSKNTKAGRAAAHRRRYARTIPCERAAHQHDLCVQPVIFAVCGATKRVQR